MILLYPQDNLQILIHTEIILLWPCSNEVSKRGEFYYSITHHA